MFCAGSADFNPRAPCGARRYYGLVRRYVFYHFNPRAPCGARRLSGNRSFCRLNFNPRAPCGARRRLTPYRSCIAMISTHAPLAGRDLEKLDSLTGHSFISTHAPLAGRDCEVDVGAPELVISTHAPLAGRDEKVDDCVDRVSISTHAPLAGRDLLVACGRVSRKTISTHAPLAGRDNFGDREDTETILYFNPRAPCGARLALEAAPGLVVIFQPTRPLRGATGLYIVFWSRFGISTHAPLAGRDANVVTTRLPDSKFQPTRPLRGATTKPKQATGYEDAFQPTRPLRGATSGSSAIPPPSPISTHAPLAGRDRSRERRLVGHGISTHAPLAGRDSLACFTSGRSFTFQPTRPLRGATCRSPRCAVAP